MGKKFRLILVSLAIILVPVVAGFFALKMMFRDAKTMREKSEKEGLLTGVPEIAQGKILKVKGFYLGMNIDEAAELVNKKCANIIKKQASVTQINESLFMVDIITGTATSGWEGYYKMDVVGGRISSGSDKKVEKIHFSGDVVDTLFNSADLPAKDFAENFVNNYKIKLMEPFVELDGTAGWRFVSPEGFKLTLTSGKDIILEKIAVPAEMKFD